MNLPLESQDVKILRWALRIATNTVAKSSEEGMMPKEEAFEYVAILDELDDRLFQIAREEEEPIEAEQVALF